MRWSDQLGRDVTIFRGLIDHSEDQISEQSAIVTFTAHDYLAMLGRRHTTPSVPAGWSSTDQDIIVSGLLQYAANGWQSNNLSSLLPGTWLPVTTARVNPDGTSRAAYSGILRDRFYPPATVFLTAMDDLAKCINGFDYDLKPNGPSSSYDQLRVFYPQQGIARTDVALAYGANVASLTRTVSSADYANYVRVIGNKANTDPNAAQLFSEKWNTDANNVTVNPVGLWQEAINASDVTIQSTLDDRANGILAFDGLLTPAYTLKLRPGTFYPGYFNMGDSVPLYINEGRLAVNTSVRIVGITYDVGEDGQENVEIVVGRPPRSLAQILSAPAKDVDALVRR